MKNNKSWLLLSMMFKSTSKWNTMKYSKDKKKRAKVIGNMIGMAILGITLIAFMSLISIGLGVAGLSKTIPQLCVLMVSGSIFMFTLLHSSGYLFGFKEYDMLVSLPFEISSIVACKFLYMYLKDLPLCLCVSVSNLVGYAIFHGVKWYTYPIWILLSLLLPMIPMVAASAVGALIVRIGSQFKKTKILQTILTFIFITVAFCSRFIIEGVARKGDTQVLLKAASVMTGNISTWYLPAKWFGDIINDGDVISVFLLILTSVLVFVIFLKLVSGSYRQINSSLKVGESKKNYKVKTLKKKSIVNAIVFKEFRRLIGSNTYLTNACFGEVMVIILGIASLFFKADSIISIVTQGAPITARMLWPSIPFIVYFLTGMVATTCITPSLEGKNYWIIQSLPITKKQLYHGKMLFNMVLKTPFTIVGSVLLGISFGADLSYLLIYVVLSIALCAFSTCLGMEVGVRHIKLKWENEIEVVKQGASIAIYLFPNMILTMILLIAAVILGMAMDGKIVLLILTVVELVLAFIFYAIVMKMAKR